MPRRGQYSRAADTQRLIAAAAMLLPQLSFFSQDQELRDHHRKPRHGLFLHVASLRRLARHRKLVLPERAVSSGTAREPSTFPRSGRPVTNQVTTTPGNTRRSATFSDTDIRLACSNRTQHDAVRRNRQAWHARGQGFESPKLHVFAAQRHVSILKMIFDLLHASKKVRV